MVSVPPEIDHVIPDDVVPFVANPSMVRLFQGATL